MIFHTGVCSLLLALLFLSSARALYEDQAGSFDWFKEHVGQVSHAALHKTKPRVSVVTRQGVIAALNLRDGSIAWRTVLGDTEPIEAAAIFDRPGVVISVSGAGKHLRAWSQADGTLDWSKSLRSSSTSSPAIAATPLLTAVPGSDGSPLVAVWTADDLLLVDAGSGTLMDKKAVASSSHEGASVRHMHVHGQRVQLVSYEAGRQELSLFVLEDGHGSESTLSSPLPLSKTSVGGPAGFAALSWDGTSLCFLPTEAVAVSCVPLATLAPELPTQGALEVLPTPAGFVVLSSNPASPGAALISVASPTGAEPAGASLVSYIATASAATAALESAAGSTVIGLVSVEKSGSLSFTVLDVSTGEVRHQETLQYSPADGRAGDDLVRRIDTAFLGAFKRKDKSEGFRLIVSWSDAELALLQQGTTVWVREEALASAFAAHFVELPAPAAGGVALETAPSLTGTNHSMHYHLLTVKVQLMLSTPEEADELRALRSAMSDKNLPVRDGNGFRKLILVMTAVGKLFALHTGDGRVLWSRTYPQTAAPQRLLPWRTFHDITHAPQVLLLHSAPAGGSYASVVDAHTGREVSRLGLGFAVEQLLHVHTRQQAGHVDQEVYLAVSPPAAPGAAPLVHLLPNTAESRTHLAALYRTLYFWRHDVASDTLAGYGFNKTLVAALEAGASTALESERVWSLKLPGHILAVTARDATESIHSSVKVLGDHSIKYRYLNPNTLFVAAGSAPGADVGLSVPNSDGSTGPRLTAHIVDTVTGRVLHRQSHPGARGPVHAVATENLVVYQYFDTLAARFTVTSMELYDATPREFNVLDYLFNPNSTKPITSFEPPPLEVVTQSYFTRIAVTQIALTRTLRGLTAKQLLLATDSSQVYMLDKRFVDPNRPMRSKLTAEEQEARMVPYQDTLPYMPQAFVTYNRQVAGLRTISVAPSRLESTCHLLVLGIDAHYTRLAPSRAFDSLEDDFSYGLLVLALVTLATGCVVMHQYTKRASLNQKWR